MISASSSTPSSGIRYWIVGVFFLSGVAALIYQVVWQRALYALFGINVESVTVVVTAFLLGLGVGSFAGGILSRFSKPMLLFAIAELIVGLYGLCSLVLFRWAGALVVTSSQWVIAFATLGLLLIPTILMGMTLPLLVAHEVRRVPEMGRAVALLYFANTAGSAAASVAAVVLIMPLVGEQRAVIFAALLNLTVAGVAGARHWRTDRE